MQALQQYGVLSMTMYLGAAHFYYTGGVISHDDCSDAANSVNHAVALVGWGTTKTGTKYWIIKNSFGPQYGEDGYILLERGHRAPLVRPDMAGTCNMLRMGAWYVIPSTRTTTTTSTTSTTTT